MTAEQHWGLSKWTAKDLDAKQVECSINTTSQSIKGVFDLRVKDRPSGEISVELRCKEPVRPDVARWAIIKIPPRLFDRMERHSDQNVAHFLLEDRLVP